MIESNRKLDAEFGFSYLQSINLYTGPLEGIAGGDLYGERKAVQVSLLSIYKNDYERQEGYKTDGQ